jgi:regulator of sigma E protease
VDAEETTTAEQVRKWIRTYDPAKHPRGYGFKVERTVARDGNWATETVVVHAAPRKRPVNRALTDSGLVWSPVLTEVRFPFPESIVQGIHYTKIWTFNVFKTLKRIVTGSVSPRTLGGIITIGVVTYDRAEKGLVNLLYFLAILSVNLAIINLLPIPVLDGGHLVFLLIEKVKGSPVSDRIVGVGHAIGLALILALIVFVTFNDIQRWIFP